MKWNNANPAPDEVPELMFCTCPRKCFRDTCPCVGNGLPCTDACVKQECENYVSVIVPFTIVIVNQTIYHLMTKTIKHSPLFSLIFKFFSLQLTLLICFLTHWKSKKTRKAFN